jgi:hypothetical protein
MAIPILKAGHFIGDLASGIGHYLMDTFNFNILKTIHYNFRRHHINVLSLEDYNIIESVAEVTPIGIPFLCINLFISIYKTNVILSNVNAIFIIANIILCSSQISHRLSHRRSHNSKHQFHIPYIVRILQDNNIILNPMHHRLHHTSEILNYCIANGSASVFLDKVIDVFNLPVSIYNNAGGVHTILDKQQNYYE